MRRDGHESGLEHRDPDAARVAPSERSPAERFAESLQRGAGNHAASQVLAPPQRSLGDLPRRDGLLARSIAQSVPTSQGVFELGMETQQGALTGTGPSGLKGTIAFEPSEKSPFTNKLGLNQIVKLTDAKGADVNPASMPAASAPNLRTTEDKAGGVEGGYFTDVLHNDFTKAPAVQAQKGLPLSAFYPFGPAGPAIFGFRRSEKAADIKAAKLFDFPGTTDKTANLDFSFETVAKGDDNQQVYGAVKWAFGLRAGKVVNESSSVSDTASATFNAAQAAHENFYVKEPVTIYFDFDQATPAAGEEAKLDGAKAYLDKFTDVRVHAEGFADLRGRTAHNIALATNRAQACLDFLAGRGIDASRFDAPTAKGATSSFTTDAGAGRQDEEALRRANRRVTLTFEHTASTP
jgi:outer membrane protein OmpA-like peptidoglycan-associated protein